MAYTTIDNNFWTDSKIMDTFTPEDKYFFLYLLSNQHIRTNGYFELSFSITSLELGYSIDVVKNLIYRMENIHHVIKFDKETNELLVLNWGKHHWRNSNKNNMIKGARKENFNIKSKDLRKLSDDILNGYETHTNGIPNPLPTHTNKVDVDVNVDVKEMKKNKENSKEKAVRFVRPTLEEVEAYCLERHNNIDPQEFYDKNESIGWVDKNGNKYKDWKAVVRTWERWRKDKHITNEVKEEEIDFDNITPEQWEAFVKKVESEEHGKM